MKRMVWAFVLILALLGRYGRAVPAGREIEELSLVTALAADQDGENIALTAVTGVRAGDKGEPKILTGSGKNLPTAWKTARQTQAAHAYLGQTAQLLLGEELARDRLMEVLTYVLDERELRVDVLLYVVKGQAGEGLETTAPEVAQETPGQDRRGRTAAQTLSCLYAGKSALVPALSPDADGLLVPDGWAILSLEGLTGFQEDKKEGGVLSA